MADDTGRKAWEAKLNAIAAIGERLPPEARRPFLKAAFEKKIMDSPQYKAMYPTEEARAKIAEAFGQPSGEFLEAGQPRGNIFQRAWGDEGQKPSGMLDTAFATLGYPGRLAREAVDTPLYDLRGKQRPLADPNRPAGPLGMQPLPRTPGESIEAVTNWAVLPKLIGSLMRIPGALNAFGERIAQNIRSAQAENMIPRTPAQLALPPRGGTTGATGPFPMPASSIPPTPSPYSRPEYLIPKPKPVGGAPNVGGPRLIKGEGGHMYVDPEW